MMRKNRIPAALCGLLMGMSCLACGSAGQEALVIGRQESLPAQDGVLESTAFSGEVWEDETAEREGSDGVSASGPARDKSVGQAEPDTQEICVYVCGAVKISGVVLLPQGSRAADALDAAGGFDKDAAEEAVNLAAKVSDGEKLYFPTKEEYAQGGARGSWQDIGNAREDGLVNINTADQDRLCTLPGIGQSRAADIIAYREANGGFSACEDIMKVSGIKESVYEKICDRICVK